MRDFYESNKGALRMAIIMIVITVVIIIATSFMSGSSKTKTPEQALKSLAILYYENEFYPTLEEMTSEVKQPIFEKYSKTGIKISLRTFLENVADVNGEIFFNAEKKINCDVDYTYVEIYPIYPYTKSDYKTEVTTNCEWNFASDKDKDENEEEETYTNVRETE